MSSEFDTSLPSTRLMQRYVKEKTKVALRLNDSSILAGTMLWMDPVFLYIEDATGKQTLVNRASIATLSAQ